MELLINGNVLYQRKKQSEDFIIASIQLADLIANANGFENHQDFIAYQVDKNNLNFEIDGNLKIVVKESAPEETANDDERTLIIKFREAKNAVELLEDKLSLAKTELNAIENTLISLLEDDDKKASAKYEGLGHVVKIEGAAQASIEKGRQEDVLNYIKSIGRDDMIKTSIHPATLTSYVNQCLKQNEPLPQGVTFYRPKYLRFYEAK